MRAQDSAPTRNLPQVLDPLTSTLKFRCLYKLEGESIPYVLIENPNSDQGARVILYSGNLARRNSQK